MQVLSGGALVPTSQEGGNTVADNTPAMAAAGSEPVTPMPYASGEGGGGGGDGVGLAGENLPLPDFGKLPPQLPVSTQPGKYGGVGLPKPPPNGTDALRVPGISGSPYSATGGTSTAALAGMFKAGPATTGNQGSGGDAGSSGNGGAWKATPGFRDPAWGKSSTNE